MNTYSAIDNTGLSGSKIKETGSKISAGIKAARYAFWCGVLRIFLYKDTAIIVIIDDKPGNRAYASTIHQVLAYCLAFKDMTGDERKIKAALRERGTENLFWIEVFTPDIEKQIKFTIDRMHGLLDGTKPYKATKNPKKCRSCRFKNECENAK